VSIAAAPVIKFVPARFVMPTVAVLAPFDGVMPVTVGS
jgi:hypothetical protein